MPSTSPTAAPALTRLSRQERRYLTKKHPELADEGAALWVAAGDEELLSQAMALVHSAQGRSEQMHGMIEAMLPSEVPGKAAVLQARRNTEARRALFDEFGALTSTEVAELAGSSAKNRAALANRWRKERRIFAVNHHGQLYFAGFQFREDGRPRPVIADVLHAFGESEGSWQIALWFTGACGWLDGARPVDLLSSEPEKVAKAARDAVAGRVW